MKILKSIFITKTIFNQQGNITFVGLLITLALMSLLISNWHNRTQEIKNHQIRLNGILCFRTQVTSYQRLTKTIEINNNVILVARAALTVPKLSVAARTTINIAKKIQDIALTKERLLASKSKFCTLGQKALYLKSLPYPTQLGLLLARGPHETVPLKEQQWIYQFPVTYPLKQLSLSFYLNADFSFSKKDFLKVKTSEETLRVSQFLK